MLPLSLDTPKPMMPLWGRPILGHIFDLLARWGVEEACLNLHHHPGPICEFVRRRGRALPRVTLILEPEILGTGGTLRKAAWFLGDRPFWIINADIAADLDPEPLVRAAAKPGVAAALWLHPERGPRTVEMEAGRIARFVSSRPGTRGTYTFCGLHLVSPEILRWVPPGFSSIITAYQAALRAGRTVAGVCVPDSYWLDIGTPDGYLQAHREILARHRTREPGGRLLDKAAWRTLVRWKRRIHINGFLAAGREVRIERGARLTDAVLWDGAQVAADAVIERGIIGTGCSVGGRVPRLAVQSAFSLARPGNPSDVALALALRQLGWPAGETAVIPFEPRGSARFFTRLQYRDQRAILVRYSLDREENGLYAGHARFLASLGLPVPAVLADAPAHRFAVLQDLGDRSLQALCEEGASRRAAQVYRSVLVSLARWHGVAARAARRMRLSLVPPFSPDLYRWEREFFVRHFLVPRVAPAASDCDAVLRELAAAADALGAAPAVLVHRDLQSSNILLCGARPYFIDFQGMRFGPAAYDLASLLCDPYVELAEDLVEDLLRFYNRRAGALGPVSAEIFWLAAVERLAQALGAYGRLGANPDTARFGRYVEPGLRMMRRALDRSRACPRLAALLQALASPAGR